MNREIFCYRLNFTSPLHLGREGIGLERTDDIIHSDTLFGAIMCKWPLFYDDPVEDFVKAPPFLISSAFPFKKNNYFFPRPMIRTMIKEEEEKSFKLRKKIKKIKFVSKIIFEKLLKDEKIDSFSEKNTLQEGKFLAEKEFESLDEQEKTIYRIREVPRVIIDRHKNSSEIFYFNEVIFSKDSGLFFLAEFINSSIKNKFEAILRLLGDEGIGGDKSCGKGQFVLEKDESFKLELPTKPSYFITLSLFHPTKEEIQKGLLATEASYEIITRGGWIHSIFPTARRRKTVKMFTEGSIFKYIGEKIYGDMVKVLDKDETPGIPHDVYRYGISFNLPLLRRENAQ